MWLAPLLRSVRIDRGEDAVNNNADDDDDCISPRDTSPHQDSTSTVPSGTPPPAAAPTTVDTGNTVPQRANPTQTAYIRGSHRRSSVAPGRMYP